MRAALGRVADAVESKLDGVHADYEKRVAEQQREGATVVPGKEVGPQWLADKCRAGAKAQGRRGWQTSARQGQRRSGAALVGRQVLGRGKGAGEDVVAGSLHKSPLDVIYGARK
eukprot:1161802-Pelagomonas_calceolata.AAC.8